MTMYFDDASRYTVDWKPPSGTVKQHSPWVANEKTNALKKMLLGNNADTATELTEEEIQSQMELWAEKSGVIGHYWGDEIYSAMVGSTVCRATNKVQAMAMLWDAIVAVIDEHSDEYNPLRWTAADAGEKVHFVAFPTCKELYDYNTMFILVAAVEFSKELCLHVGTRLNVSLFHPKYKKYASYNRIDRLPANRITVFSPLLLRCLYCCCVARPR
jgi:hypothetical protein